MDMENYNHDMKDIVNYILKDCLNLKSYELICPKCEGWSMFDNCDHNQLCSVCKNKGKIDWIDNIKNGNRIKKI